MSKTASVTGGAKSKRNATSFSKENPRPGPGRGNKKAVREAGQKIVDDMEYAYSTKETPEDSPGIKSFRILAHEDLLKFTQMWLKAKEMAGHGEAVVVPDDPAAAATAEAGVKEESIEQLANRLLDEWYDEEANQRRD